VLPQWIAQRLQALHLRVKAGEEGERTLKFFADRVEGNLLAAHQEMQKLALLYPGSLDDGASQRELSFDEVEAAVLNVARYDVFKLSEAVLAGNVARVQRMLDGLQAEGEATVLVHWTLSEDIRALHRLRSLMDEGKPLPMALQEARVWGMKQKLFERILPRLSSVDASNLLHAAHQVDGIVKGLKQPGWPADAWVALHQLAMMVCKVVV
jgi:DNA polymerase III subunit delta